MKRWISALLVVALTVALAGCGAKQTPFAAYEQVRSKHEDAQSVEMDMTLTLEMDMGVARTDAGMDCTVACVKSGNGYDVRMDTLLSIAEHSMTYTAYLTDGYMYADVAGQKLKAPYANDGAVSLFGAELLVFTEDMAQDATIYEFQEGGDRELTFAFAPEQAVKLLGDFTGQLTNSLLGDSGKMTVTELNYSLIVGEDDMLKAVTMTVGMDMEVEGQAVTVTFRSVTENFAYDRLAAIDFPADLDAYVEDAATVGGLMPF